MKILITGGAGFIGSNLALELSEKGHQVTVLDNLFSGKKENLKGFTGKFIEADINVINLSEEFGDAEFDVISHQAAITDTTFSDDKEMLRANVGGFQKVLEFAAGKDAAIVYASSASTYGRGKSPMKEEDIPNPLNAYAESKSIMDVMAKQSSASGKLNIVGLRYFNVYGPREFYKGNSSSMIYQLYKQMKSGANPRIFKYGEQERDFVYVKDVVQANLSAISYALRKKSGIFNVGVGKSASFNKLIEELNRNMRRELKPNYFDNPYGFYQNVTCADMSLTMKELGFHAIYDIEKGIKDYVAYLEEN
ncbi:MAG: ADP-L-glycero-D-manno-heptose-6-epimerase [Elusimicrobia bacterium ADurb.Bin231]|nr:MAG: ADP-L-glycero-D-manno-heptose-6-epimerase [Elusimicrobia bacterium ADurb.Bin231]